MTNHSPTWLVDLTHQVFDFKGCNLEMVEDNRWWITGPCFTIDVRKEKDRFTLEPSLVSRSGPNFIRTDLPVGELRANSEDNLLSGFNFLRNIFADAALSHLRKLFGDVDHFLEGKDFSTINSLILLYEGCTHTSLTPEFLTGALTDPRNWAVLGNGKHHFLELKSRGQVLPGLIRRGHLSVEFLTEPVSPEAQVLIQGASLSLDLVGLIEGYTAKFESGEITTPTEIKELLARSFVGSILMILRAKFGK